VGLESARGLVGGSDSTTPCAAHPSVAATAVG